MPRNAWEKCSKNRKKEGKKRQTHGGNLKPRKTKNGNEFTVLGPIRREKYIRERSGLAIKI